MLTEKTYPLGALFTTPNGGNVALMCMVGPNRVCLLDLSARPNRCKDPIIVADPFGITQSEVANMSSLPLTYVGQMTAIIKEPDDA